MHAATRCIMWQMPAATRCNIYDIHIPALRSASSLQERRSWMYCSSWMTGVYLYINVCNTLMCIIYNVRIHDTQRLLQLNILLLIYDRCVYMYIYIYVYICITYSTHIHGIFVKTFCCTLRHTTTYRQPLMKASKKEAVCMGGNALHDATHCDIIATHFNKHWWKLPRRRPRALQATHWAQQRMAIWL